MSLLEDVFLQNEADEAQELERVIEGDDYDDGPRPSTPNSDDDSEKEDEAEEDKRRVDPSKAKEKRVVKNPRLILNPARLTGPRGIQIIPDHFKSFKFKGKGHEKEDLDLVLKRLEHWAYRLFPKFKFEDCLKKMETLGKKRPVMVHLHKIRTDQYTSEETVVQRDSSDEENTPMVQEEDEFDKLLQQQIELARATPAPGSVKKGFDTPAPNRSLLMPKATSSPSINEEQRERMLRNRRLAEERRLAKLKQSSIDDTQTSIQDKTNELNIDVNEDTVTRKNRSNIIDSSDEECDNSVVNQSITVDIHNTINGKIDNTKDSIDNKITDNHDVCHGDIELDLTNNKSKNTVIQVTDNELVCKGDSCQGDVEANNTINKIESTLADVEADSNASHNNIADNVSKNKEGNPVAEDCMDIPTESNPHQIPVEKEEEETELNIDSVLKDINNSEMDNDCTVERLPNVAVITNDENSDKHECSNNSVEIEDNNERKRAEIKGIDAFGDDLDIMDVDFSEEF